MDNRLYQQLSTGWTFRWQRIVERVTAPKFMLELSLFLLILLFLSKTVSWYNTRIQITLIEKQEPTLSDIGNAASSALKDFYRRKLAVN